MMELHKTDKANRSMGTTQHTPFINDNIFKLNVKPIDVDTMEAD